jgi:hypothetical protein
VDWAVPQQPTVFVADHDPAAAMAEYPARTCSRTVSGAMAGVAVASGLQQSGPQQGVFVDEGVEVVDDGASVTVVDVVMAVSFCR